MKKILIILIFAIGCKEKEDPACDCGVIVENIKFNFEQNLYVENYCTGNTRVYKEGFLIDYEVGQRYCPSKW
jgi:hypothetical protein